MYKPTPNTNLGTRISSLRPGRPTAALVVSIIALIVALGGTSYAAFTLPNNSVGTKQLKKNSIAGQKIKRNAVTSGKVRDGSLLAADFKAGQLPAGPQGPKGDPGPQGPKGDPAPPGASGLTKTVMRFSPYQSVAAGSSASAMVYCDSGETATGGGAWTYDPSDQTYLVGSAPGPGAVSGKPFAGWGVRVRNTSGSTQTFQAYVVCAS